MKEPYGIHLEVQKNVLQKMTHLTSNPILPQKKKKNLEWFQKGIIISNNALIMLH